MVAQFSWIIDGQLAGSARPGLMDSLEEDRTFLRDAGFRLVVCLTEDPFVIPQASWRQVHFPIDDMGAPTPRRAHDLCRRVLAAMDRSEPVLLHCKAGLGRTGTMLGCCLVALGRSAQEAIEELRRINRHYIQSEHQEAFLGHYEQFLAVKAERRERSAAAEGSR